MGSRYTASIGLRGHDGQVVALNYDLGEFNQGDEGSDHLAARSALNQIKGALVDITAADLAYVRLTDQVELYDTIPVTEDARVYVKALVSCHLNAPNTTGKYVTISIPAPIDGIFQGEEGSGDAHNTINVNNPLLQQYVQQLAQHTYVSDGERINTDSGAGGIRSGRRTARPIRKPGL